MHCPTLKHLLPPPEGKTIWPWAEESPQLPDTMPDGSLWPKVSIVTPSYNQGKFIEETIRSVLLQGYPNLEYIIIDGGSTDNSVEIIKKYESWLAYWVSEPDKGQSNAINKGFEKATGDVFGWLNSDDVYVPGCLNIIGRHWHEKPETHFLIGNVTLIDEESKAIGTMHARVSPNGKLDPCMPGVCIPQPATFLSKDIFQKCGPLDESMHYAMDMDFWIHIASQGTKFHKVDASLSFFRRHRDAKSAAGNLPFLQELVAKYGPMLKKTSGFDQAYVRKRTFICLCMKLLNYYSLWDTKRFIPTYRLLLRTSPLTGIVYGLRRPFKSLVGLWKY